MEENLKLPEKDPNIPPHNAASIQTEIYEFPVSLE